MTINYLQELVQDQEKFKKEWRRADLLALLKGQFREGRLPFIHQVTLPSGAQVRFKFYDCIKRIYNNKGQELSGKESFLSYLDISVAPVALKGYSFTADLTQVVWGTSMAAAEAKHLVALEALKVWGVDLDIDLSTPDKWCKIYSESVA